MAGEPESSKHEPTPPIGKDAALTAPSPQTGRAPQTGDGGGHLPSLVDESEQVPEMDPEGYGFGV